MTKNNPFLLWLGKHTPRWLVLCIDMYITATTFFLAHLLRYNFSTVFINHTFVIQMLILIILALLSFIVVGSYKGIVRHTGVKDAQLQFQSNSLLVLLMLGVETVVRFLAIPQESLFPYSIIGIFFFINVVVMIALRYTFKFFYRTLIEDQKDEINVLVYGTSQYAISTSKVLSMGGLVQYQVVGFIDQDKKGSHINGIKVFPLKKIKSKWLLHHKVNEIIIAEPELDKEQERQLIDYFLETNVKLRIVPPLEQWINGELQANQIKDLDVDDLLGRVKIQINNPQLSNEFKGKTILVTGAAGSIGSEIVRQLMVFDFNELVLLDVSETALYNLQQEFRPISKSISWVLADVRNASRIQEIFEKYHPHIVFHAAAYKHVPLMEAHPWEAVETNGVGTKILADLSTQFGVQKFIMVSTDKAVNPTNVMGATKRLAEIYVSCCQKNSQTAFIITRFGNVLGSNGSVVPLFTKQIKQGGPITLTHPDITRYFMAISEAAQLVLEAGAMGKGGEIFIFDMGQSVRIMDLAKRMIRLSGRRYPEDINIEIVGLRPGEKIFEELLADGENTMATYHPKIRLAGHRKIDCSVTQPQMEVIFQLAKGSTQNHQAMIKAIKELIPEYISNNSIYKELDV